MSYRISTPFIICPPADLAQKHPDIFHLAKQLSRRYAQNTFVPDETLKRMGQVLWQALNIDTDFNEAKFGAELRILPIVIHSDKPSVFSLPWECLYHPKEGFLGKNSRYILSRQWQSHQKGSWLKRILSRFFRLFLSESPPPVLLFTALPDDLPRTLKRIHPQSVGGFDRA